MDQPLTVSVPAPVPLGPKSILGRIVTDPRITFTGFSAGLLQLMHPAVSAAVIEHGEFFKDPFDRVYRSVPRIVASITAPDGAERARQVRDYHRDIKGVDTHGNRYHALDPEVYWWTHMCFVWGFLQATEVFGHRRLTEAERTQFYAETVEWWRRYGMSMRLVPVDLETFLADFDRRCAEEVEWTPAAEFAINVSTFRAPLRAPFDLVFGAPVTPVVRLAMHGTLPPVVRHRFAIRWTPADAVAYAALARTVAHTSRFVPTTPTQHVQTFLLRRIGARMRLSSDAIPA